MYYKQTCPSCQKTLKFPPEGLGRKVRCPYCRTSVTLDKPTEEAGAAKQPGPTLAQKTPLDLTKVPKPNPNAKKPNPKTKAPLPIPQIV